MIVWCQKCGATPIAADGVMVDPPVCAKCMWIAGCPVKMEHLCREYELWNRRLNNEFNTVDLKQLREERVKRRGRQTTTSYSHSDISRWLRYQNRAR